MNKKRNDTMCKHGRAKMYKHRMRTFSHCGCLRCDVFKNHLGGCIKFIPCKPVPRW